MKPLAINFILLLVYACVSCGGSHPIEVVAPIMLPDIPSEYSTDLLVVPTELKDEFSALMAIPRQDWLTVDINAMLGEQRRAATYWRFYRQQSSSVGFWLELNGADRQQAELFHRRLAEGWTLETVQSYYLASRKRAYYWVFRKETPAWKRAELAWLCDWLQQTYPDQVSGCSPDYIFSHSEGAGNDI